MNTKQRVFVECYLQCWNASEAARLAGYSVASARDAGSRLLTDTDISSAINARIADLKMGADEVLVRLAEQARGDILDFIDDEGKAKIAEARTAKKGRLIKKLKHTERTFGSPEFPINEKTLELELYDAQAALVHIGKVHKLFTTDLNVKWEDEARKAGHDPIKLRNEIAALVGSGDTGTGNEDSEVT